MENNPNTICREELSLRSMSRTGPRVGRGFNKTKNNEKSNWISLNEGRAGIFRIIKNQGVTAPFKITPMDVISSGFKGLDVCMDILHLRTSVTY